MILEILWLAYHNSEIDWKTGKVKIIRWMWEAVKGKTDKARMAKTEKERVKEREETKREEKRV